MRTLVLFFCLFLLAGDSSARAADEPTAEQRQFAELCPMYKELLPYRGGPEWALLESVRRTALAPCAVIRSVIMQRNQANGRGN